MTYIISNSKLELSIDSPNENYQSARFDWSGKIAEVSFRGLKLTTTEQLNSEVPNTLGRGLYNEFGIDSPLGFSEAKCGEWFHKIGVGLLRKTDDHYLFHQAFEINPCEFSVSAQGQRIAFRCESPLLNGYAYVLEKEIELLDYGFIVKYHLLNKGRKEILTDEYSHNFLSIGSALIGSQDTLKFPFPLNSTQFDDYLNPKDVVQFKPSDITFLETPNNPFFFSNICNDKTLAKNWILENKDHKIGMSETTSFLASKVNLWGAGHVISPELFHTIKLDPGETQSWWRRYDVYELDFSV
jgi:hypothetical protein